MPDSEELLGLALDITAEAGQLALQYFRSPMPVTNKASDRFDPVTRADREIEALLRERIRARFPGHGIIGEEHGDIEGSEATWVIDPIDGTRGFITGSPMWGMLLGVMQEGIPALGVLHQPFLQETWYGGPAGAFLRSAAGTRTLCTRDTHALEEAALYCTHPAMFDDADDRAAFARVEAACQFSRYGGDCYGYALLAAGFADLVIEATLQPYDIIPLLPLVEAAGGVVSDWSGRPPLAGGRVVASANATLHEQALNALAARPEG